MARRTKKRQAIATAKRGTFITSRASGYATIKRDFWPSTVLSPYQPKHPPTINRVSYSSPARWSNRVQALPISRPRRPNKPVSGMHDTYFKRLKIDPYAAFRKGVAYTLPGKVKVCVQRKIRREAVFATTGGGSIRRKSTNQRSARSHIWCI